MIKPNPFRFNRKNLRLADYDYSDAGAYFITVCTHKRQPVFGEVHEATMQLNPLGEAVHSVLENVSSYHDGVSVDTMVVMPDHIHAILTIDCTENDSVKSYTTYLFRSIPVPSLACKSNKVLWQRNYYEHVIRTQTSLQLIREYIQSNPARFWQRLVSNSDELL